MRSRIAGGAASPAAARPAIALAAALGGIVIIGVMITGVFFAASQEYRVGNNVVVQEQAFRAAELGLNATVTSWDNVTMAALPIGGTRQFIYDSLTTRGWIDTVVVARLNATGYHLLSTATARGPFAAEARRRTGMTIRLSMLNIRPPGALTVRQKTTIAGSALISGIDENPASWLDCPPLTGTVAAVATPNKKDVGFNGCPKFSCLFGSPALDQTTSAADTMTYFGYGDESWSSLTKVATKVYSGDQTLNGLGPVLAGDGSCNKSSPTNWGNPLRTIPATPCESYFPIIWAKGKTNTVKLTGGIGQGILLVEGDLEVSGGFSFYGPIVVRGELSTTGMGGTLYGATLAANTNSSDDDNEIAGDAVFKYSQCTISNAARAALAPRRMAQRAWVEVF